MPDSKMTAATKRFSANAVPVRTLRAEVIEGPDRGASHTAVDETLTVGTSQDNDLPLTDSTVSRYHLELKRRPDGVLVVDHGSTNGTILGAARLERAIVPAGTTLSLGHSRIRVDEGDDAVVEVFDGEELGGVLGRSPLMRRLMKRVQNAARSDASILLVGESGTGKEKIAEAIHALSERGRQPFVTVDCGALAPTLISSELFGHEKGAFTGADQRRVGAFEQANGGTLFLDEVGELPRELQPMLLGALERRRFRRLGGSQDVEIDVRVIGATHRDLRAAVNIEAFRLDLYYRIAVVVLTVPPLRERTVDIPLLVEHFLRGLGHEGTTEEVMGHEVMDALLAHDWPGNVRELRNVVTAAVAMRDPDIVYESLAAGVGSGPGGAADPIELLLSKPYKEARDALLHQFEDRYLRAALERSGSNVSQAARECGMDRSYMNELLKRHGLR